MSHYHRWKTAVWSALAIAVTVMGILIVMPEEPAPPVTAEHTTVTASPVASPVVTTPPNPLAMWPGLPAGQWGTDAPTYNDAEPVLSFNVCLAMEDGSSATDNHSELFVDMWVKNDGAIPATFATRLQNLVDKQGRIFAPRTAVNNAEAPPGNEITDVVLNPTLSVHVTLYYHVPPIPSGTIDPSVNYMLIAHSSWSSPGMPMEITTRKGHCE
jgi:hypothetical protein